MGTNYKKLYAIQAKNKAELLRVNPNLDSGSGIYFLTRTDENGFKYAYIGQAKNIMQRMLSHMTGYQHIDLSLKKHKFYSEQNIYGWKLGFLHFPVEQLDEMEQFYIKEYANQGYQLRNKTAGGQGEGKSKIDDYKPPKTYRQGIAQGRKSLAKELSHIIDLHLEISLKKPSKTSEKALEKFRYLLSEETYNEGEENDNS